MPGEDDEHPVSASVIVPARDAADTLPDQLAALAAQDAGPGWELLLVDNGSTDDTLAVVRGYADTLPGLRLLSCTRPGANAARNEGVRAARSDLLLFCDADDVVDRGWVRTMTAALEDHAAVGGRLDNDTFPAGHMPRYPDGLPVSAGFLPRAITANFGIRREVWDAVGGFSEAYEYGSTDTEFCWRLQLSGYELHYARDAVVAYRHRSTLRSAARKAYLTGRAQVRLFRDFQDVGMPRSTWPGTLYRWGRLVATSPLVLVSDRFRWTWVREASGAVGRVVGSLQLRQRYL